MHPFDLLATAEVGAEAEVLEQQPWTNYVHLVDHADWQWNEGRPQQEHA